MLLVYPAVKDVRDLNILHDFDLKLEYGPCLGLCYSSVCFLPQLIFSLLYTFDKTFILVNAVPSIHLGISRLERWTRAQDYGLDPPAEVKKIIEEHSNDTKFTQWSVG